MARIRINTRTHTKEKPYLINSYFFFEIGKAKKVNRMSKIHVYVGLCEWDMCWRYFCTFSWWLKNVQSRSKIARFSNGCHSEIWFPKKKTITFFSSELSKLHKIDPILHMTTTFSLKQGETVLTVLRYSTKHAKFWLQVLVYITHILCGRSWFKFGGHFWAPTITYSFCDLKKNSAAESSHHVVLGNAGNGFYSF